MKKSLFSLFLFFLGLTITNAQTNNSVFLKLGGAYTNFQDAKFSKVPYSGAGVVVNIGFEKESPRFIWETGLFLRASSESASTHEKGSTSVVNPKIYFRYLKKVNDKFSIGGHWNIMGIHSRNISGLDNNGNYYLSSSDLLLATNYKLNKLDIGLDLGLLSFMKEGTSFSFSAPQSGLEDGDFNYQNDQLSDPFGFKYFNLRSTFNHFVVKTHFNYQLNDKFSVGYQWNLRRFSEVENYPVTMGAHNVMIRWSFIQRSKENGNRG